MYRNRLFWISFTSIFLFFLTACGVSERGLALDSLDARHREWTPILSMSQAIYHSVQNAAQLSLLTDIEVNPSNNLFQSKMLAAETKGSFEIIKDKTVFKLNVLKAEIDCLYQTVILETEDHKTTNKLRVALHQTHIEPSKLNPEYLKGIPYLFEVKLDLEGICQPLMSEALQIELSEKSYDAYTFSTLFPKEYQTIAMLYQHQHLSIAPNQPESLQCSASSGLNDGNDWVVVCEFNGNICMAWGSSYIDINLWCFRVGGDI